MSIHTLQSARSHPLLDLIYYYCLFKCLQDVCKTTIFYADKMVQRVSRGQNNNADFEITESLCLAINNIDYVLQYIQPFVNVSACLWKDNGSKKKKVSRHPQIFVFRIWAMTRR
jgi:hypothetical protein